MVVNSDVYIWSINFPGKKNIFSCPSTNIMLILTDFVRLKGSNKMFNLLGNSPIHFFAKS